MKIFRGLPSPAQRVPVALTIGNFDGVHRGHQALLAKLLQTARQQQLTAAVMTFEPHPREFFAPQQAPARVTNLRDKASALASYGIEHLYVMHFNQLLASLPAERFIQQVLIEGCSTRWLMVGDDFRFGAKRQGNLALLQAHAAQGDYQVEQLATVMEQGERISSSNLRAALARGALSDAARLLGHPYRISGHIQHGAKLGRTLGFRTINLRVAHRNPAARGVFAVRVHGLEAQPLNGVASLGLRPTVEQAGRWLLEVHLFDFARDVYGHLVSVELVHKLRDEEKYDNLAQLQTAMAADAAQARTLLAVATAAST